MHTGGNDAKLKTAITRLGSSRGRSAVIKCASRGVNSVQNKKIANDMDTLHRGVLECMWYPANIGRTTTFNTANRPATCYTYYDF